MAKTRLQKEQELQVLEQLAAGKAVVLTGYTGLSVGDMRQLRQALRAVGGGYRVVKTSLLRKALGDAAPSVPTEAFGVQLAIATHPTDEVEANKAVVVFGKTHEAMQVLGAIIDGQFIDEAGVRRLAALPGRDELYAKLVGSVAAPISGLVNVLAGNLRGLVSVLNQYQQKRVAK